MIHSEPQKKKKRKDKGKIGKKKREEIPKPIVNSCSSTKNSRTNFFIHSELQGKKRRKWKNRKEEKGKKFPTPKCTAEKAWLAGGKKKKRGP
jgi:hypothetical protein